MSGAVNLREKWLEWRSKGHRVLSICTLGLLALSLASGQQQVNAQQGAAIPVQATSRSEILRLVHLYVQSIDAADPTLGAMVWDTSPEVSFIEPRGQERGWNQIVDVFYRKTMGTVFSNRTLTVQEPITVHTYGDAAVVEFTWSFVGLMRDGGKAIHTSGRESQVYVKFLDRGWRLVQVHYSGPALKEAGKGF